MATPPASMNRKKFRMAQVRFEAFLQERGAEVLAPTNEWELCRFRHGDATAIVYTNKRGDLKWVGGAGDAFVAFTRGTPWRAAPATLRRTKSSPTCLALRQRDGEKCFYCHQHVLPEEESVEHLVGLTHGGPDHIANMALAHKVCNQEVGNMPLMQKILVREGALARLQERSAGLTIAMPAVVPDLDLVEIEATARTEPIVATIIDYSEPPWDTP